MAGNDGQAGVLYTTMLGICALNSYDVRPDYSVGHALVSVLPLVHETTITALRSQTSSFIFTNFSISNFIILSGLAHQVHTGGVELLHLPSR